MYGLGLVTDSGYLTLVLRGPNAWHSHTSKNKSHYWKREPKEKLIIIMIIKIIIIINK